jgi:hypothetical protein
MDSILKSYIVSFVLGGAQLHENMAVFPIGTPLDGGPDYMTLKEALEQGAFTVTEVSEGGNVPNLKVSNKAGVPVLLLDGEELAGAKQNRVLNTTILIKEGTEVVIPVSCTEQGRWSYVSREFFESGNVMSPNLRSMNRQAVAASLESRREFVGNQGAVWNGIHRMAMDAGAQSSTGAMRDVFEAKKTDLDAYLNAFTCGAEQKGLLVMIGGAVVGFDFISRDKAFATLFPKLIKSYAMEAWLENRKGKKGPAENDDKGVLDMAKKAQAFMAAIAECGQKSYDSVGMGKDIRLDGKGIVGSALVVDDKLVHMAFFSAAESEKIDNMAGPNRRRSFRI